ncbi:MAG: Sigma-54 dependent DNA-binding response regulator [Candidatus Wolfebacteria bacterium GW2011_GWC1_43_10]|uniref:Sigma-54 dependent DNA-binding response regulator n=3 Tax=Patescibacteria group TaxID=1783273 RepID=A0A0G1C7Q0_9BACT|nr:MAG: Sigma-54 dependent DNA-binding response regulator [Candidatus Wolfebacteria bacterium GW2011_GWC1_43_10]KKU95613.1 MAG: Response regulator receiver protein [Candidatus Amesbacteria bacterium GW2011_GWB1_48_13]OGC99482.1 MAG: hypothetical protein A2701_03295 [Candidatus Amesbacteria bacterium RIFCSPHIGHO2_01_FULL_47_34]OGD00909.1 MAG: hypothetical protein A2972_03480 [Candidatus Amesbacteria bacterium RIFCSPLOWO2_01_FULL_47_33]
MKRILIVDDDVYLRELYSELLISDTIHVDTAIDGQDGLTKASQGGYDLILLDVMMPKLDGLQVLTALKASPPATANGPIYLLTNLAHEPVVEEALKHGAAGFLVKSDLTPQQFVEQAQQFLGRT